MTWHSRWMLPRWTPLLAALVVVAAGAPRTARAQADQLELRLEGGGATMVTDHQRSALGYDSGGEAAFRAAFRLLDFLAPQVVLGGVWFPADNGTGQALFVGGGLRAEPRIFDSGRLFVDADLLYARSGSDDRFAFDVGVGLEIDVASVLSIGPYVRYHHIVAADADHPADAGYLSYGASVVVRAGEPPAPVTEEEEPAPCPDPDRPDCVESAEAVEVPEAAEVAEAEEPRLEPVYFETNSDVPQADSQATLQEVLRTLEAHPELTRVQVEGYADDRGSAAHNLELSERRARRVVGWLVEHGIDAGRLESRGYGEAQRVPGTNATSRARNRRVDFRVLAPGEGS